MRHARSILFSHPPEIGTRYLFPHSDLSDRPHCAIQRMVAHLSADRVRLGSSSATTPGIAARGTNSPVLGAMLLSGEEFGVELARAWGLNRRGKEQNLRKKRSASSGFNVADEMDCRPQSYRVTSHL